MKNKTKHWAYKGLNLPGPEAHYSTAIIWTKRLLNPDQALIFVCLISCIDAGCDWRRYQTSLEAVWYT